MFRPGPILSSTGGLRRRLLPLAVVVALLAGALPVSVAHADGQVAVLDQSFISPAGASAAVNECCRYMAQTFTAGMTGALTAVSLDVLPLSDLYLKVAIQGVTNGLPDGRVYSEVFVLGGPGGIPLSYATLDMKIDVGTVFVQAGEQYAIVVSYDGSEPGQAKGSWAGATGDNYAGGAAYATSDPSFTTWNSAGVPGLDLHFQTYVVPNVPISDLDVTYVSGAKKSKACGTFEEIYNIRNLGPDTASHVVLNAGVTDQFDVLSIADTEGRWSAPYTLAPGESLALKVVIKTTAFVPGESREGRVMAHVSVDDWPNIAIDPNEANDYSEISVRLQGRGLMSCP
ncbi:MAG: hypothetical protein ACM3MF_01445 [Anaerolineae bacterium]